MSVNIFIQRRETIERDTDRPLVTFGVDNAIEIALSMVDQLTR